MSETIDKKKRIDFLQKNLRGLRACLNFRRETYDEVGFPDLEAAENFLKVQRELDDLEFVKSDRYFIRLIVVKKR